MVVGVHLDHVRAGRDLVARRTRHLVGAADLFRALRDGDAGFEPLRPVCAARDIGLGRNEQARAGDDALVDRLLEPDVGIAGALGAEVALGGEAGVERALGVDHGARGPECQRLVQDLVVPLGLIVRVQKQMRVAFDHAGDKGGARKLDHLRSRRSNDVETGRDNPVALYDDLPAGMRVRVHAVEHLRGFEHDRAVRLRGGGRGDTGNCCGHGNDETHRTLPGCPQPKPKGAKPPRARKLAKLALRARGRRNAVAIAGPRGSLAW
jgi:hypothetical protein